MIMQWLRFRPKVKATLVLVLAVVLTSALSVGATLAVVRNNQPAKAAASTSAADIERAAVQAALHEGASVASALKVVVTTPDYFYLEPSPTSAKSRCMVEYGGTLSVAATLSAEFYKGVDTYADGQPVVDSSRGGRYSPDFIFGYTTPAEPVPASPYKNIPNCKSGVYIVGSVRQLLAVTGGRKTIP